MDKLDIEMVRVKKENSMTKIRNIWIYLAAAFFGVAVVSMGIRLFFMHVMAYDLSKSVTVPSYITSIVILQLWYVWAVTSFMVLVSIVIILRYSP